MRFTIGLLRRSHPLRFITLVAAFVIMQVNSCSVLAQQLPDPIGVWTSLCLNQESGDLNGMEIIIMPNVQKPPFRALVQITDGGTTPFMALLEVGVVGKRFEFTVPEDWGWSSRTYSGKFKGGLLVIESPAGNVKRLRRGHSYWELPSGGYCK
jgi:hypothetical protein